MFEFSQKLNGGRRSVGNFRKIVGISSTLLRNSSANDARAFLGNLHATKIFRKNFIGGKVNFFSGKQNFYIFC